MAEFPVQPEQDLEDEEEARRLKQARKDRKFSPLYCFLVVPLMASFRLKEMAHEEKRTGDLIVLISKSVLYIPSILFTFYYPLKTLVLYRTRRQLENRTSIASFALRLLTVIFGFLFVLYELSFILPCFHAKCHCSTLLLIERSLELLLFIGLALFVFFNKWVSIIRLSIRGEMIKTTFESPQNTQYPRKSRWNLFFLSNLLSAALHAYFLTIIAEEQVIYQEIVKRNNHTDYFQPTIRRRQAYWGDDSALSTDNFRFDFDIETLFEEYKEMILATICEFLVVAISINIGIICLFGKTEQPHHHVHHHRNFSRMVLWTLIVLVAFFFQILLIFLNVQKANSDSGVTKLIFVLTHICVLLDGLLACAVFHCAGNGRQEQDELELVENQIEERTPAETLDRYLLYFGTAGFFFYSCFGIVHSAYLIPTDYPTNFAIGSVITNICSVFQALAQTGVILHRDMVNNYYGFGAGVVLWVVNFIMFCLDLFDAATFGIYSNPVPEGSNVMWTMFVRGLGPFDVFYRFHSLAIIAENIEHHLHRRQHLGLHV